MKIRASWCAVTGARFPLWLAKESGILARHRIDADLQFISGSDVNNAAIMRGDVDFVECSGGAMAPAIMAGSDAVYVASFYLGNFFRLMAAPDVQSLADLRGRKMAISRPGDYTNRLSEIMLERAGLVPNQDVTLIPIGNQADQFNALRAAPSSRSWWRRSRARCSTGWVTSVPPGAPPPRCAPTSRGWTWLSSALCLPARDSPRSRPCYKRAAPASSPRAAPERRIWGASLVGQYRRLQIY